jgi:hypothetical protein
MTWHIVGRMTNDQCPMTKLIPMPNDQLGFKTPNTTAKSAEHRQARREVLQNKLVSALPQRSRWFAFLGFEIWSFLGHWALDIGHLFVEVDLAEVRGAGSEYRIQATAHRGADTEGQTAAAESGARSEYRGAGADGAEDDRRDYSLQVFFCALFCASCVLRPRFMPPSVCQAADAWAAPACNNFCAAATKI